MSESIIKYFRLLYDQIPFPVQIINEEGRIVYVNHAFTFQWGYNISELNEYKIFNDSELKKSGAHAAILEAFEKGTHKSFNNYADSLLKSKEITLPVFRTKIFHVPVEGKTFVALFHEDQTEMVLTEEEIKKARDGNKEAERLKDTFLTVLSHELRTPLNIVLGYSSIIKETMRDKISSEDRVYIDNLYSGSERLYKSITQMLEFAQIEAGKYVLNLESTDLVSIIKSCIELNKKNAEEKKLDIKTKFPGKKTYVDADAQSLESAINNLLNNAIKFTRQGFVEIEIDVLKDRDLAICKIKDSGVGISPEYLDHLFRPFSQEDLNIGRNFEGNGLGLALAKRYIEKMGGSLLVDSIKGVGSTFSFTLPLSSSAGKKNKAGSGDKKEILSKILLIDDLSESYDLLSAFLKDNFIIKNHDLKSFNLGILDSNEFDLIILDVNQNRWDQSLKLSKEIKQHDPLKRPILIISNEYVDDKIKQFYDIGISRFLVKPFSKSTLLKAFDEIKLR